MCLFLPHSYSFQMTDFFQLSFEVYTSWLSIFLSMLYSSFISQRMVRLYSFVKGKIQTKFCHSAISHLRNWLLKIQKVVYWYPWERCLTVDQFSDWIRGMTSTPTCLWQDFDNNCSWGKGKQLSRCVPSGQTSQSWHRFPLLHTLVGACITVYVLQCYFCVCVWVEMMSRALQISICSLKVRHIEQAALNEVCV